MSVQNENTAGGESVVLERPSASADECVTAAIQVFMQVISQSGQRVEKLDKTLIDMHIAELDWQISRQLDEVMHHPEFQKVESLWCGIKHTVDRTDFRQNVKVEILDVSKESLRQDFEDSPEIIQSGLYAHTYILRNMTPLAVNPLGRSFPATSLMPPLRTLRCCVIFLKYPLQHICHLSVLLAQNSF